MKILCIYEESVKSRKDTILARETSYVKTLIPGGRGFMGRETYGNRRKG